MKAVTEGTLSSMCHRRDPDASYVHLLGELVNRRCVSGRNAALPFMIQCANASIMQLLSTSISLAYRKFKKWKESV